MQQTIIKIKFQISSFRKELIILRKYCLQLAVYCTEKKRIIKFHAALILKTRKKYM